ncbi:hypothetical protein JAAARDRAFT_191723 [Jaapia argillacea MUCL 33604]|uniref:Cell morphogenesis protein N-terminal domain-containing protein n=1 Tax=Jaapia argillacea MUCL 33604 TaxID=933084 RepID=A0A067QCM3_9AGAM|nr:hypothetical protein JAAARDRAFT_191723 [Jaapia argillacea MUCL 33604]
MSDGFQITIPEFDEEELYAAPIPFGRAPGGSFGFGSGGGSAGSGQESPTGGTPLAQPDKNADRGYFHSRNDSAASETSVDSFTTTYTSVTTRNANSSKVSLPFAHSSSSSFGTAPTTSSPFAKKTSFASFRNAFKSGKSNDPPPVPPLDRDAYPVLKNPFNRSTSSLAYTTASSRRPTVTASPPRPPTPANDFKFGRGTPVKTKGHVYARSQHSHTGSIFHSSDTGSDLGHGYPLSSSPPPVPRMPDEYSGSGLRDETPPPQDFDDRIVMDPRTSSEYALHAVFMRFVSTAESHIDNFLRHPLDRDPPLTDSMGPGVDSKLDDILQSLGRIAQKNAKPVIDSIMRWRRSQNGEVDNGIIRLHMSRSPSANRSTKPQDERSLLIERKSLACIYVMCRALIVVMQSLSKDALAEMVGYELEDRTFEQFRSPNLKLLAQSANHRTNADLYASLLGLLANFRFESVTDRFLRELQPVSAGQVPKDSDMKYEHLVRGLRHIQIKVWPPEFFDQGAEFMESLSKSFGNAHGFRLKTAFAETLTQMLHPIGKTAQAEVNHPDWAKAIEIIHPRARDMMTKPRYWQVAYPLAVTSLCVAPHEYFLRNWTTCFENGLGKLKDKVFRIHIMNGMMRLLWTYLYRCHEPGSTTTAKLDALLKHFFPSNRQNLYPNEDHFEPFIYIVHFVLSRHFDYGRDLCLELIQESLVHSATSPNVSNLMSHERLSVGVQAILLSAHGCEQDKFRPAWPSNTDFSIIPPREDYASSADYVTPEVTAKAGMEDLLERCGSVLAAVAVSCANSVGHMSVMDDQWAASRMSQSYEETHNFVFRRHPEGIVAYPSQLVPQINMLHTCFQSWPRCLHPNLSVGDTVDALVRGVLHVEPKVAEAAFQALRRFLAQPDHASMVILRYTSFMFDPKHVSQEGSGIKFVFEHGRLLSVWATLVDSWIQEILRRPRGSLMEEDKDGIFERLGEVESGALFLITHIERKVRSTGVQVLRSLALLLAYVLPEATSPAADTPGLPLRTSELLRGKLLGLSFVQGHEELIKRQEELERLKQWQQSTRADVPLRIADSNDTRDYAVWEQIFPSIVQTSVERQIRDLFRFRETVVAAASRYHPFMAAIAGINFRAPAGLPSRNPSGGEKDGARMVSDNMTYIRQWRMWMRVICATAASDIRTGLNTREHSRGPSEGNFERERMATTRGLFRCLAPFLDSEHTIFRDAAVLCISSFPSNGYPQLLEDLNLLAARQFFDESRSKQNMPSIPSRTRRQERFYAAVARIYYLTAHCISDQRVAGRQAALAHVLKFVRHTQAFLTSDETRDKYMLQRLRRYFCGAVERLFDGMATLKDSDRFIPPNMHLSLYRLCEEWCQCGAQSKPVQDRLIFMQSSAGDVTDPHKKGEGIERFMNETKKLSKSAVGAMAALCPKAYFPPDVSSGSPMDNIGQGPIRSLDPSSTLDRWNSILASYDSGTQGHARKALRSLLGHPRHDATLLEEALRRAFVTSKDLDTSNSRFFEVVADVILSTDNHGFSFSQIVCLGLSNLSHHLIEIRRLAFNMLEKVHVESAGILSVARFEAAMGSSAPGTYLQAHRLISDMIAGEHPHQSFSVLTQFVDWMPRTVDNQSGKTHLLLLQSLEYWVSNIDLMSEDRTQLSQRGCVALYNLIALTLRYADSHAEQILTLWTRLVDSPHQHNGHATVRFLLEQSHKVGSTVFIDCASRIVACLSQSTVGRQVFQDLSSLIEPARMLPTIEHKLQIPDAEDIELWSDLDALFSEQPRQSLATAQFALLFLADVALDNQWEQQAQLPVLLHALFVHVDHRIPFVRHRARRMLFQLLRSWMAGYDDLADRSSYPHRLTLKATIANLEREADALFWKDEDASAEAEPKMHQLCTKVLDLLEPLFPKLSEKWGSLALAWGTSCSIRAIAFRSMQVFRALMPKVTQSDLALLLGRLSSTVAADQDEHIQNFTVEIILTLEALTTSRNLDPALLPQIFWCSCACLNTTIEQEFTQILSLLESLLVRFDLNDPDTVEGLILQRPSTWTESKSLQSSLLVGLRSSNTYQKTFKVLQHLAKVDTVSLIDQTEDRLRDLYIASLPWCLRAKSDETYEESLLEFARNLSQLAAKEGRASINRILDSFIHRKFRTTDDFLRQSISSIREHYAREHWTDVVTLLLGFMLNKERWLRTSTMQILKMLFQQLNPVELPCSELLMPLLRLLETDLAPEALGVLDEPMTISGGLAAKHILRLSMNIQTLSKTAESSPDLFGVPEESGWCVAHPDAARQLCRANVIAVFDTCQVPTRPSRIDFEPDDLDALADSSGDHSLGDLVQNLHDLSTFFREDDSLPKASRNPFPPPSRQLEARVAAILAKSTDAISDTPQTPFVDAFHVGNGDNFDDSDDDGTDSDSDAFIFDSLDIAPIPLRSSPSSFQHY